MKTARILIAISVLGSLAACTTKNTGTEAPTSGGQGVAVVGGPAERTVYFDYDKSDVKETGKGVVSAHVRFLKSGDKQRVRLEGHCDERGSPEYNIGLGERRSQTVRRLMTYQGVADRQLETVSYGEERPAVEGRDEGAWAKNRRVEIVYIN